MTPVRYPTSRYKGEPSCCLHSAFFTISTHFYSLRPSFSISMSLRTHLDVLQDSAVQYASRPVFRVPVISTPTVQEGSGTDPVDATAHVERWEDVAYAQFLAASPSPSGQSSVCSWNQSYEPASGWPGPPDHPVVSVDWCDAHAYCAWAGKRLCGHISGGSVPFDDTAESSESQWYRACSRGGERVYPYGATQNASACHGGSFMVPYSVPVGSSPCCEGGYEGLFDMVGNVAEWEDACGGSDVTPSCRVRGSAALGIPGDCGQAMAQPPNFTSNRIGFRCCSGDDTP